MTKKLNATHDQIVEAICSVAFAKGASSSLRENIIEALSTLPTLDEREVLEPFMKWANDNGLMTGGNVNGTYLGTESSIIDRYLAEKGGEQS